MTKLSSITVHNIRVGTINTEKRVFTPKNQKIYIGEPFYEEKRFSYKHCSVDNVEIPNPMHNDKNIYGLKKTELENNWDGRLEEGARVYAEFKHFASFDIEPGAYTLWEIINELIKRSHTHTSEMTNPDVWKQCFCSQGNSWSYDNE